MANANAVAAATIAIAMAAYQPMDAELITAIAEQCGMDSKSVINLADEVMAAKVIAESDMNELKFNNQNTCKEQALPDYGKLL